MRGDDVRRKLLVVLAAFALALVGVACGGDDGEDPAAPAGDEGGSVNLSAADFAFQPSSITASAEGTIAFTNEDETEHSFTIDDTDVDEDAEAGASVTVDLGSLDAGTYDFYCKYHKDSMTGTLEVTG